MSHLSCTITTMMRFHLIMCILPTHNSLSVCQKILSSFRKYAFKVSNFVTKTGNSHFAVKNWGKKQENLLNAILQRKKLLSLQNSIHIYSASFYFIQKLVYVIS